MFNSFRKIGPSIKLLMPQVVFIIILSILYLVLIKNGYQQVLTKYQEFKSAQNEEELLNQKVASLREIGIDTLGNTEKVVVALPEENSSTFAISQIRKLATENNIVLSNIEMRSSSTGETVPRIELIIEGLVESAEIEGLLNFTQSLDKFSPITNPKEIEIERGLNGITIRLELASYWSPLPETLPQVTEPIGSLTNDEEMLLVKISNLNKPQVGDLTAQPQAQRDNPFN